MYQVVYLTGPPATGKTTLCAMIAKMLQPLRVFSYSKVLAEHVGRRSKTSLSQDDIRRESGRIITPEDVRAVDDMLLEIVRTERDSTHIIIDSHAVTKEDYGFRVTAFSISQVTALSPTLIFVLYASHQVIINRIASNDEGRPLISEFEADFHASLQASVAINYAIHLGVPVYFLDSAQSIEILANQVVKRVQNC
jgi:adenylate kinase